MGVDPNHLDPIFLDFSNARAAQKRRFMGEFFPAEIPEGASGKTFLAVLPDRQRDGQSERHSRARSHASPFMIKNERQFRITKAQADQFQRAIGEITASTQSDKVELRC